MSDTLHRFVSGPAIAGKKVSLIPGRLNKFTILKDTGSVIYFTLKRSKDSSPMNDQAFLLTGQGIRIRDKTDSRGMFRYGPVRNGEYVLEIENTLNFINACSADEMSCEVVVDTEADRKK